MNTIDVIKSAYRQTKDGFAITFVLHPQDDHDELARAPIGSQWQIRAIPLDDDGNPQDGLPRYASAWDAGGDTAPAKGAGPQTQDKPAAPAPRYEEQWCIANAMVGKWCVGKCQNPKDCSAKPYPAPASRLTQLAGICCNDPVFWKYLAGLGYEIANRDHARDAVYDACDVKSRKEFIVGTPAGDRWLKFYDKFALWKSGHPF